MGSDASHKASGKKTILTKLINTLFFFLFVGCVVYSIFRWGSNPMASFIKKDDHMEKYRKIKVINSYPFTISLFFDNVDSFGSDSVIGYVAYLRLMYALSTMPITTAELGDYLDDIGKPGKE